MSTSKIHSSLSAAIADGSDKQPIPMDPIAEIHEQLRRRPNDAWTTKAWNERAGGFMSGF